jgi:hypothetical protein
MRIPAYHHILSCFKIIISDLINLPAPAAVGGKLPGCESLPAPSYSPEAQPSSVKFLTVPWNNDYRSVLAEEGIQQQQQNSSLPYPYYPFSMTSAMD